MIKSTHILSLVLLFASFSCKKHISPQKNQISNEKKILANDEASIISAAKIATKNTVDLDIISSKGVSIMSKHIVTFDYGHDNFLDALVFWGFKNNSDNSFYKSKILFLRNNGKELIATDSLTYTSKYIIPSQSKTFYSNRGDGIIIEKYSSDAYGKLSDTISSRGIVIYLRNSLSLDRISTNDIKFNFTRTNHWKYVSAKKGLYCRDQPGKKGKVIHTLNYGEAVNVIRRTNKELTIYNEDINEYITGDWVCIKLNTNSTYATEGYVFNGYLTDDNPN